MVIYYIDDLRSRRGIVTCRRRRYEIGERARARGRESEGEWMNGTRRMREKLAAALFEVLEEWCELM